MRSPLQTPAKALTGHALLAYYFAARANGLPLYDHSWTERIGGFRTWRIGQVGNLDAHVDLDTILDRLVRLGVLERIEGPLPRERSTGPLEEWLQPEDSL